MHDVRAISRRELLRAAAGAAGAALALDAAVADAAPGRRPHTPATTPQPAPATFDFNRDWRFGGPYTGGSQNPGYSDARWPRVNLPHTVTRLSWGGWNPASWQQVWVYRKPFSAAKLTGGRVWLDFDGVMTSATVYLNGVEVGAHQGGFLPWSVELTDQLLPDANVLAVVVDGRWLLVPPEGHPAGPSAVDYLMPAGIYRDVRLRLVPNAFIADLFARPGNVLSGAPSLTVETTIDAAASPVERMTLTVQVRDGSRVLAQHSERVRARRGTRRTTVTIPAVPGIQLWSPAGPKLYTVRTALSGKGLPTHVHDVSIGFRQATFQTDGFYLNGERLQIFGLNRHQLFPYTGMAASARLQARDAQLIKNVLNCNMVRCSHYPQSPHFLDACDRLGLMVWEEPPGWGYVGDPHFQQLALQNVRDMVVRDRNRPSVIVWGTRLNETGSYYQQLYADARAIAYAYDGTRQTSGTMTSQSTAGWAEDVFAYDDYHSSQGNAVLAPPVPGVPYLVTESVGSLSGAPLYRWIDSSQTLQTQARMHAQVHNIAGSDPAYSGLLVWAGIDYDSYNGGNRIWQGLKWGGVLDTFRVPKPGASIYRSQVSPAVTPLILPAFYWDFGPSSPPTGPGASAMIATNCDELQLYLDDSPLTTATPDAANYGNLRYPPAFADLTVDGSSLPTLRIDGYVGGQLVTSLQMSSNPATDRLALNLEDTEIAGDGTDATRITFRALDAFGNQRPYVGGDVTMSLRGPAVLLGDNPFPFALYGGVGGAHIRSEAGRTGAVTVTARHPTLGQATSQLRVVAPRGRYL